MASTWCKRCDQYDVWGNGCTCSAVGYVWKTEDGERGAREVWSKHSDHETIVIEWVRKKHLDDYEFMSIDDSTAFSFKPHGSSDVEHYVVRVEMAPSYSAEAADENDDVVESALEYLKRSEESGPNVDRTAPE